MFKFKNVTYQITDVTVYTLFSGNKSIVTYRVTDREGKMIRNKGCSKGMYMIILQTEKFLNLRALHTRLKINFQNSFLVTTKINISKTLNDAVIDVDRRRGVYMLSDGIFKVTDMMSMDGVYFKDIVITSKIDFENRTVDKVLSFNKCTVLGRQITRDGHSVPITGEVGQLDVFKILKSS